jgi:CO/xanthine dehydrogenase Mo-binding subunit
MATNLIGTPVSRVDGRRKVTGKAEYAAEVLLPNLAHAVLVGATVASGRIERIDTDAAMRGPGVLLVLTHENRGPLGKMPSGAEGDDFAFNTLGCRGAGEIGITGMAGAIANAVYHATGVRVRDLPIAPETLL